MGTIPDSEKFRTDVGVRETKKGSVKSTELRVVRVSEVIAVDIVGSGGWKEGK